jgi:hypothetical protein
MKDKPTTASPRVALEVYSGNHFCGPPGHGASVVGFKALRWLLDQLDLKQPRRFKKAWRNPGISSHFNVRLEPVG